MVKVKLLATTEQHTCFLKTMKTFIGACNYLSQSMLLFRALLLLELRNLRSQG